MTRLRNPKSLRDLAKTYPHRLADAVKLYGDDLAVLRRAEPLAPLFEGFDKSTAIAERALRGPDEAAEADAKARASALKKAVAALRRGNHAPAAAAMATPSAAPEGALFACEAALEILTESHETTVERVRDSWPVARRELIAEAEAAHAAAAEAVKVAREKTARAATLYEDVARIDVDLLDRHPGERAAAEAERRSGLGWYAETHSGARPLKTMPVPGAKPDGLNNRVPRIAMDVVWDTLVDAVGAPGSASFAASGWSPLNDAEHEAQLAAPLDLTAGWVVAAVRRQTGGVCSLCGNANADVVIEEPGGLAMAHRQCLDRPPSEKERARAERQARRQRSGYPPAPFTSPF